MPRQLIAWNVIAGPRLAKRLRSLAPLPARSTLLMQCPLLQWRHMNDRMSGVIVRKAGVVVALAQKVTKDTGARTPFRRTGALPMILLTLLFQRSSTGSAMRKGIDRL